MNEFKSFGIKPSAKKLVGKKIDIYQILGHEIIVEDFRLEDSKIQKYKDRGSDKCLYLQFQFNNEQRIVFTSGHMLIEAMNKIPEGGLPFKTTIIEKTKRFEFT